ncbi:WD40/YVTN/BNR-like repeat-containing protein [Alkalihalobacterium bogoriense]|uniref:WD40/YVTN/BNR-like repeat-containing protein n=1 Tax=Alkalihalobacterium bogoriense TaxID=246272 RepID=UPI00047B7D6C|nr:hypothetical protein [Alkalihalobacterium bogoriense]
MKKLPKKIDILFKMLVVVILLFVIFVIESHKEVEVSEGNEDSVNHKQVETLEKDIVFEYLPMTMRLDEGLFNSNLVYSHIWSSFVNKLEEDRLLTKAYNPRFQFLEGNEEDEFVVAAIFHVLLGEDIEQTNWGNIEENRTVLDLVWKLFISKNQDDTYTLEKIEWDTNKFIGLPSVQDKIEYETEVGLNQKEDLFRYEIVEDTLKVTYNDGGDWLDVPVEISRLFEGDYNGTQHVLIEGSYVISPERTAFVIGGDQELRLLLTRNQGATWEDIFITREIPGVRLRLLGFTSEDDGYLIATGYRTMTVEGHIIFKTNDGGYSWYKVTPTSGTSLVTNGNFINNELGYLSFGYVLYRTDNGGESWHEADVSIPEEFKEVFTVYDVPIFNGDYGVLLVNQGQEGDYLGGTVVAKMISNDQGLTWSFDGLVDMDGFFSQDMMQNY